MCTCGHCLKNVPGRLKAEADHRYLTQVSRCDKYGVRRSLFRGPGYRGLVYEREYKDLVQAIAGHKEVVQLLAEGRLKLTPRDPDPLRLLRSP
jgi:hypothetical protein